ncbi:MAG: hypothetical protein ACOC97_03580 [Myxococcota bacterium]
MVEKRTFEWLAVLAVAGLMAGCPQGPFPPGSEDDDETAVPASLPAGASCAGVADCPSNQVCVEGRCRYAETSVAGEVLASAAAAQLEAGDFAGAVRTFDEAIDVYDQAQAPVPPAVLCGAAVAALQEGGSQGARERAARRADACLRGSLPGDPQRDQVLEGLTRLRYEGLDATLFDQPEPAERFFTKEPSRPTVDTIAIRFDLPDADEKGYDEAKEAIQSEEARRAIADCFLQDWDIRHERSVQGSFVLKMSAKMKDMGYYDVFEPEIEVTQTSLAQDGFDPCVAGALAGVVDGALPKNVGRRVSWQHPFEVSARLQ